MSESKEIDVKVVITELLRRLWLILLCAILIGAGVYAYTTYFVTPLYRASATLYVNNTKGNATASGISASDLATSQRLVTTYMAILQSDTLLDKVAVKCGIPYTAAAIRSMMSAEAVNETEVFAVQINHPNPETAVKIANAVAEVATEEISNIVEGSSTKVIDYARLPKAPFYPSKLRNTVIGGCAGALLMAVAIIVQTVLNVRIKSEEDLRRISSIPVLGTIPVFSEDKKDEKWDYGHADDKGEAEEKAVAQ